MGWVLLRPNILVARSSVSACGKEKALPFKFGELGLFMSLYSYYYLVIISILL